MRVIHVVPSPRFAGVERHVALLARTQANLGVDVHVIGGREHDMRTALDGVPFHPCAAVRAAVPLVRGLLRSQQAAVLHAHMTAGEITAALTSRSRPRDLVVTTRHLTTPRGRTLPRRLVSQCSRIRIERQIAVSHYVVEQTGESSTVVLPGVPCAPDRRPPQGRVLTLAQRLEPEKDTVVALAGFRRSGLAEQGWTLRVAGDGSLAEELRQQAQGLPVEWLGHVQDVKALMAESDVLLAPCAQEALGLSVLEAMAVGVPVLAAGAGGHLETVGAVDPELLFAPGDADALADRLHALLARDLGEVGRRLQERQRRDFTLERQARETSAVYEAVLAP